MFVVNTPVHKKEEVVFIMLRDIVHRGVGAVIKISLIFKVVEGEQVSAEIGDCSEENCDVKSSG